MNGASSACWKRWPARCNSTMPRVPTSRPRPVRAADDIVSAPPGRAVRPAERAVDPRRDDRRGRVRTQRGPRRPALRSRTRPTRPRPLRSRRRVVDAKRSGPHRAAHNVRFHYTGIKHFHHPIVGDLKPQSRPLDLAADAGLTILAYTARTRFEIRGGPERGSWAATLERAEAAGAADTPEASPRSGCFAVGTHRRSTYDWIGVERVGTVCSGRSVMS
jgi:hypothetical protein